MGVTNYIGEAWRAGKSFVIGLNITFKEMVMRPATTIFYPDVKDDVPPWFRGIPVQRTDLLTGEYKCTSCEECVDACPVGVIDMSWHQDPETKKKVVDHYTIDMSRCMLCNLCVEACLFDSLVMGMDYELCKIDPANLVYDFDALLKLGLRYSKATDPYAPKAKRGGVPSWVFAPLTDATEADIQDENGFLGRAPLGRGYTPTYKPEYATIMEEKAKAAAEAAAKAAAEKAAAAEAAAKAKAEAEAKAKAEAEAKAQAEAQTQAPNNGEEAK